MFGPAPVSSVAVVLDAPSFEPLEPLLDALEDRPVTAAIGPSLLAGVGPSLVQHLRNAGLTSVLDLRLFDGPRRMALLVEISARAGVAGLSLQLAAGEASLRAAKSAARGRLPLIGVLAPHFLAKERVHLWPRSTEDAVAAHAKLAETIGLDGVMGTPEQLRAVDAVARFPLRWAIAPYDADDRIDAIEVAQDARSAQATTVFLGRSVLMHATPGHIMDLVVQIMSEGDADGR